MRVGPVDFPDKQAATLMYNEEGGIVLPYSIAQKGSQQANAADDRPYYMQLADENSAQDPPSRQPYTYPAQRPGVTYNEEGGIVLPNSIAAADAGAPAREPYTYPAQRPGVTYNEEGGVMLPNSIAAADAGAPGKEPYTYPAQRPGVTYNEEGGIVLPNSIAASNGEQPQRSPYTDQPPTMQRPGVTYNEEGGIVLPNSLGVGSQNSGYASQSMAPQQHPGVTYNEEGGIVLPNSVATGDTGAPAREPYTYPAQRPGVSYNEEGGIVLPNSVAADNSQDQGYSFEGQAEYYDLETRSGACGKKRKNTELVAAVNGKQAAEDGPMNGKNANCGKKIQILGSNGQNVKAEIVDFCMACGDSKFLHLFI